MEKSEIEKEISDMNKKLVDIIKKYNITALKEKSFINNIIK